MTSRKNAVLLACAVLVAFLAYSLYEVLFFDALGAGNTPENSFFVGEAIAYPSFAEISDPSNETTSIAFAPDPSSINFGTVPSGGNYATKYLDISNNGDGRILIFLGKEGGIAPMVAFPEARTLLEPKESKRIAVRLVTSNGTAPGKYDGRIILAKVKAKNAFADLFLALL